jgi:hypothetical protein
MWLARKQLLAHKREVEEKLAAEAKLAMEAEAKLAMEAKAKEEARIKEEKLKEELRIKEQDALADSEGDGVTECIKEVADTAPADSVGIEVSSKYTIHLLQFSSSASEACHVKLSNPGP